MTKSLPSFVLPVNSVNPAKLKPSELKTSPKVAHAAWSDVLRTDFSTPLDATSANSQRELFAPRLCNTGVQITSGSKGSKVDWLEFTVKGVSPDYSVLEYLDLSMSVFTLQEYGMQGYTDCHEYGKIKVLFSPSKPERGTKIILCATALDEVGRCAVDVIKLVLRDGGTFARIDLALDDRSGLLNIDCIWLSELAGLSVCHFEHVAPIKKYSRHSRELVANGVNYGSRTSTRFVRCYDKRLEQIAKGEPDCGGSWVRIELQANKRGALVVAGKLAELGLSCIPSIVSGALDFRYRHNGAASNRSERVFWWAAFLGDIPIIKTGVKKAPTTMEKKVSWLSSQCRKTMGQASVYDSKIIADMVRSGIQLTTKSEWAMLFPDRNAFDFYSDIQAGLEPCPF